MRDRRQTVWLAVSAGALLWMIALLARSVPGLSGSEAAILQGISAESLAGSTPGRQALVGSAWWGPLPLVLHLAATFLATSPAPFGTPLAVWLSGLWVVAGCLFVLRSRLVADGVEWPGRRPPVHPLVLAILLPGALRLATGGAPDALVFPLALFVTLEGSAWLATGLLRHLVPVGFALAALLLCGATAWGWVLLGVLLLALGALRSRVLARRLPALLLLGLLPVVYALGVWALLNWLILQDGGFFLRVLGTLPAPVWLPVRTVMDTWWEQASVVLCAGGILAGLARRDGRRVGYGLAGLSAAAWLWVLAAFGLAWADTATRLALPVCALLLLARGLAVEGATRPLRALVLQFGLVIALLGPLVRASRDERVESKGRWNDGDAIVDAVAAHVTSLTRHAKVFVCGYEGLGLLRGDRRNDLFVPVLDMHLDVLRRDYWGQNQFVLVRRPVRRARMESLQWREPDFHTLGSSRTLLSADFGDWRLYEVVSAPTLRELQRDLPRQE